MFKKPLRLALALVALAASIGCSSGQHDNAPFVGGGGDDGEKPPIADPCQTPNTGCGCGDPGQTVDCGQVERRSGDYVSCSVGVRTCGENGKWGACIGDSISTLSVSALSQRTQSLGMQQACIDNPCDPFCQRQTDTADGLDFDGGPFTNNGGLTIKPTIPLPQGSGCTGLVMTPSTQDVTVTSSNNPFIKGEYFNNYSKTIPSIPSTWTVTATRTEYNVDYDWGTGAPTGVTGIPVDKFTVRWTGSVIPNKTEAYTFYTVTDDGARLWINNTLVVDKWQDQGSTEFPSAAINLTAGVPALFRFEYFDSSGSASARLRWSSPSITKQVIPSSVMGDPTGKRQRLSLSPGNPQFNVALVPSGCFAGTLTPAWTLDRFDVASVTDGAVNLISAVPGTLKVTAYAGQFSATGTLNVKVDDTDATLAPANAVTNFAKTVAGTDPMTILYPYANTVLPLGMTPPVIQWDTGGTAADAVKISLRWPATGTATFQWNKIIPESTPPSAAIPQAVWKDLENTGKGQDVRIRVQRLIAGVPAPAVSRNVRFSSAPVRGLIYYTQYNRGGATNMMVADPASTSPAKSAFATVDGCPVCHSVSANGNYFATSDKSNSATNGGLSKIQSGGVLNPISDFIPSPARDPYKNGTSDWRGFAWAPLTPDGSLALTANNIFGNTRATVIGIDQATRTVSVGNVIQSGGNGTGLLAQYFPNTTFTAASPLWKRIDPIVWFDHGTASPGAMVPVDYSVRRSGLIQAFTSETYTFQIDTVDGVKLTVNGTTVIDQLGFQAGAGAAPSTFTGSIAMTGGTKVAIQLDQLDSANESSVKLSWSAPTIPLMVVPQAQLYTNDGVHGMDVSYFSNITYAAPVALQRVEPDIYATWGNSSPAAETTLPVDNFSDIWLGQLESPYTGNVQLCVDSDDDVEVTLNGTVVITRPNQTSNAICGTAIPLVQGTKYPLQVKHVERTGGAFVRLRWIYGTIASPGERIPTANLYVPVGWTAPTTGLTATYYGDISAGSTLTVNPTLQNAFTRTDPTIYNSWGNNRTEYSQLSNSDRFSARWTGRITTPCTGMYEFRTNGNVDDGGRMWIDQLRVAGIWATGAFYGSVYLTAGDHDFKFGYWENNNAATVLLQWKVNCQNADWAAIPQASFKPTGDVNRSGIVRDGGDNANNSYYTVWQTPQASGDLPVDVSAQSPGIWGLGSTAMMVPSFSPDAKKLVFVDGDSAAGAGWRKGLSTFDFDQTGKQFRNRRSIVNTWPFGDALKWPTFESDSRSIIYQSTVPWDACCQNTSWTKYGYMTPTNYYEDPGRLWSVDSQAATPTPVPLTALNAGERPQDANKVYQPTVSPRAAGGYRWVVFTSTRPYGNTFNAPSTQGDYSNTLSYSSELNYNQIQSQLWVAAIDDTTSGATDRSHPAFWLPQQNYTTASSGGYVNERGFWVLDSCKSDATTCEVDEDCCGGLVSPKTSVCRLDTPVTDPPTRHCGAAPPVGMCVAQGGVCATTNDCCIGSVCLTGTCSPPPPILILGPANYERTYTATCEAGTKPVWRFFDWQTVTPADNSKLEFYAQTSTTGSDFATLPIAPTMVSGSSVVKIGQATGAPITTWTGADVGAKLLAAGLKSQRYLKVTIRLIPNDANTASPTLTNWRQNYSCVPAE